MCHLAGTTGNGTSTITIGTQSRPSIKVTYPRPGSANEGCAFHDGADSFYMEDGILYICAGDKGVVAAYREWITVEKIAPPTVPVVSEPFVWPGDTLRPYPFWANNNNNSGLKAVCGHDVSECPCRVRSFDCSPDNNKTGS